jgi:Ser/Thr protein kinase RdoA (MazF antagonist)
MIVCYRHTDEADRDLDHTGETLPQHLPRRVDDMRAFDAVLERMYQRTAADKLPAHLTDTYGFTITATKRLDVGVYRIDRPNDPPLIARLFPAKRPHHAAMADLAVLRHLAARHFPAERPFEDNPLTTHEGQAVLVTEFVRAAPKSKQPPHPIIRLGARIARLHGLPVPPGADRPSGALHHFAEGTMTDELKAAATWLDDLPPTGAVTELRAAIETADGGDGLPEAFVHPDPVPRNAIFTEDGPVLVDWTSAGRGPRLPSMVLILRSGWAAKPFLDGYTRHAELTDEEKERLPGLLLSRRLIDLAFRFCQEPETADARRIAAIRKETEAKARDLLHPTSAR